MLFERFESVGLAHYSYLLGDGHEAVVIDPRRDCPAYISAAGEQGMRITHVLETHRNEDCVAGSLELAHRTGAVILRSDYDDPPYMHGRPIRDGETLPVGGLTLRAMHTPGHTLGHMSYLLTDRGGAPWMLFAGDALFAGAVGRVDFMGPGRLAEMAGLLYDSVFAKILPLGDEVILCPAHGAGSACGAAIADRPWTTIGLERKLTPQLRLTGKADFVQATAVAFEQPHYFRTVERLNLEGPPPLALLPDVPPLSPQEFVARMANAQVVDTRPAMGMGGVYVSGALSLWAEIIPMFAGWSLTTDKPILLVAETNDVSAIARDLRRLGYDRLEGFLAGGMLSWVTDGLATESTQTVNVQELCRRLDSGPPVWILDVRSGAEVKKQAIPGAQHIHITQLPMRIDEVPADRPVYVFCASGKRASLAASLLRRSGRRDTIIVLGGLEAWDSVSCPLA